jgi:cytochrome c biogenesis protein CcdA
MTVHLPWYTTPIVFIILAILFLVASNTGTRRLSRDGGFTEFVFGALFILLAVVFCIGHWS